MADSRNLMFRLGLDTKDFDKQMQDELAAAKKTAEEIRKAFEGITLPTGKGGKGGSSRGGGTGSGSSSAISDVEKQARALNSLTAQYQKLQEASAKLYLARNYTNKSGINAYGSFTDRAVNDLENAKNRLETLMQKVKGGVSVPYSETQKEMFNATRAIRESSIAIQRQRAINTEAQRAQMQGQAQILARQRAINAAQAENARLIARSNSHFSIMRNLVGQVGSMMGMYFSVYALQNFIKDLVRIRGEFDMQYTALKAILQSGRQASELFGQLKTLAPMSPYQFKDLATYAKQLSAYSIPYNELFDTTKRLADLSSGLGVDFYRIVLAYGQVRSAAVLRGQELRQFTEAGIPMVDELAKKFTKLKGEVVSAGDVFELISERQVPFQMVKEVIDDLTNEGGKFYMMQEKQAETLKGKVSNLADRYDIMMNSLGESLDGFLKGTVDMFASIMEHANLLVNAISKLAFVWGGWKLVTLAQTTAMGRNIEVMNAEGVVQKHNVSAIIRENEARKQKQANLLREAALYRNLSGEERKYLANAGMRTGFWGGTIKSQKLTSKDYVKLVQKGNISQNEALRLAYIGKIDKKTLDVLRSNKLITKTQYQQVLHAREMVVSWLPKMMQGQRTINALTRTQIVLYRGMAGLMAGLGAMFSPVSLGIMAATAGLTALFSYLEEGKERAERGKQLGDAMKESYADAVKFIKDNPIEITVKTGDEEQIKKQIANYEEELRKQLPSSLASGMISSIYMDESGKERTLEQQAQRASDLMEAYKNATEFVNANKDLFENAVNETDTLLTDDLGKNIEEMAEEYAEFSSALNGLDRLDISNALKKHGLDESTEEGKQLAKMLKDNAYSIRAIYERAKVFARSYASWQQAIDFLKDSGIQNVYNKEYGDGIWEYGWHGSYGDDAIGDMKKSIDGVVAEMKTQLSNAGIEDIMSDEAKMAAEMYKKAYIESLNVSDQHTLNLVDIMFDTATFGSNEQATLEIWGQFLGKLTGESKQAVEDFKQTGAWSDGFSDALHEAGDRMVEEFPEIKDTVEKEWGKSVPQLRVDFKAVLQAQEIEKWRKDLIQMAGGDSSAYAIAIRTTTNPTEAQKAIQDAYDSAREWLTKQKPLLIKFGVTTPDPKAIKTVLDSAVAGLTPWQQAMMKQAYNKAQTVKEADTLIKNGVISTEKSDKKDKPKKTGSQKDKVTEQLQKTYDSQKKALQKFNELRKTVSDETAKGIIKKDYGIELQDSWLSQFGQLELIATTLGKLGNRATDAAKNFRKSLNDEKSALLADKDIFGYSVVAENISKDVELLEKRFKVYDDFFKKSGNANISALIAFGDQTKPYKDTVEMMKSKFAELAKGVGKEGFSFVDMLGLSEEDRKRVPKGLQELFDDIQKKIADGDENARSLLETVFSKTDDEDVKMAVNNANKEELLNNLSSLLFGDTKELSEEQQAKLNELRPMIEDYYNNLNKELTLEKIKKSLNWEELFSDIGSLSISQLDMLISQLDRIVKANKDLDPQKMKEWVSQLDKLKEQRAKLEPYGNMFKWMKDIRSAREQKESISDQITAMPEYKQRLELLGNGDNESIKKADELLNSQVELNGTAMTLKEALDKLTEATEKEKETKDKKPTASNWITKSMGLFDQTTGGLIPEAQGFVDIFNVINSNIQSMDGFRKKLGIDDDTVVGKATSSIAALSGGVSNAIESAKSGDVFGILNGLFDGFSNAFAAIFGGADYTSYENMVEEYGKLINVWDILIDRKKEYLEEGYTEEIERTAKEIEELYSAEEEAQRTLGKERLNSGASIGSHSIGVRIKEGMSGEGWAQLAEWAGGKNTELYKKVTDGRMTGLFDLSAEQLKELQDTAPVFWAKLDSDVQEYLNKIIEIGDAWEDAQEEQKEWWTQTNVDSLIDGFTSALDSMDDQTKTFANNFTKTLRNAIINAMLQSSYFKNGIEAWRDKFYEYMSDGDLSDFEINDLKNGKLTYTDDDDNTYTVNGWNGLAEYADNVQDKLKQLGLYADQTSGSLSGSIQSITEETADLLASYVNAIRADVAFIRSYYAAHFADDNSQMQDVVTTISVAVAQIEVNTKRSADNTDEIIDLINAVTKTTSTGKALRVS